MNAPAIFPELVTESTMIPSGDAGIELYLRNKRPAGMTAFPAGKILLYVHGATYPSETAFDLPIEGASMMDLIAARGYDVWLVDVRGVRRPVRPAEVLGLNAIVAFAVSELLFRAVLSHSLQPAVVGWLSDALAPVAAAYLYPAAALAVIWAVCALLARRGIVVRI